MAGLTFARTSLVSFALTCGAVQSLAGCDSTITSVGAWEPLALPSAGQGGQGGDATGESGGAGAGAGGAGAGGAGAGGAGAAGASGLYIEAESGVLSGGFLIGADVAASGDQYLLAPVEPSTGDVPGPAQARYVFEVPEAGSYKIWGRIYSPDIASNRFFFQVDGSIPAAPAIWRITVGKIWYWDDFHIDIDYNTAQLFELTAGTHELVLYNAAASVRLDRLYITAAGDEPPGNDTRCNPPHSIDLLGPTCALSCGSQAPAGMGSTCDCGDRTDTSDAYDCGGTFKCCVVP